MEIFTVEPSDCTCPNCGKTTLLVREVQAIQQIGLCFDCVKLVPTVPEPSLEQLTEMESQGYCKATDGCSRIEPDGHCPHGYPSWLLHLGYI